LYGHNSSAGLGHAANLVKVHRGRQILNQHLEAEENSLVVEKPGNGMKIYDYCDDLK
jgi:hypothetical protein